MSWRHKERSTAPLILQQETRSSWVVSLHSRLFTPKERAFEQKTGWPQNWSRRFGEQMKMLNLPEFEPRIAQPVI